MLYCVFVCCTRSSRHRQYSADRAVPGEGLHGAAGLRYQYLPGGLLSVSRSYRLPDSSTASLYIKQDRFMSIMRNTCLRFMSPSSATLRLSKLLLRLPALRLISAAVTEELFFAGLIGNVQIDSIIPYILKMESTDYNSQAAAGVWQTVPCGTATLDCENSTASQVGVLHQVITKWS